MSIRQYAQDGVVFEVRIKRKPVELMTFHIVEVDGKPYDQYQREYRDKDDEDT